MADGADTRAGEAPAREAPADMEEEVIMHLERDQLVEETLRPLAPARVSRRTARLLWGLRILTLLLGAMVIYTFIARLS
jgi:hypothetical protein